MDYIRKYVALDANSPTGLVWLPREYAGRGRRIQAGTPALVNASGIGYYVGTINGTRVLAHIVVFYLTHGYVPSVVDHIDGNTLNNAPGNLRGVTHLENNQNRIAKGCSKQTNGRWRSRIHVNGKDINLGTFDTMEAAHLAYLAAKKLHHPSAPARCFQ